MNAVGDEPRAASCVVVCCTWVQFGESFAPTRVRRHFSFPLSGRQSFFLRVALRRLAGRGPAQLRRRR